MKKLTLLLFSAVLLLSCSADEINETRTDLEGVWRLQNIQSGAKLTFEGNSWKLESGTAEMSGTFTLVGGEMAGEVIYREGQGSDLINPDNFTGGVDVEGDIVYFTNFSGDWRAPFSSWYKKQ